VEASFSILLGRVAVLVLIFATYFFSQKKYAIHAIFPTASNILSAMQMNGCFFLFLLEMPLPTAVTERWNKAWIRCHSRESSVICLRGMEGGRIWSYATACVVTYKLQAVWNLHPVARMDAATDDKAKPQHLSGSISRVGANGKLLANYLSLSWSHETFTLTDSSRCYIIVRPTVAWPTFNRRWYYHEGN